MEETINASVKIVNIFTPQEEAELWKSVLMECLRRGHPASESIREANQCVTALREQFSN